MQVSPKGYLQIWTNLWFILNLEWHFFNIISSVFLQHQLSHEKVPQRISVIPENWHFNSHFVLKTTKTAFFVFINEILRWNFWRHNWWTTFDVVKKLRYFVLSCDVLYCLPLSSEFRVHQEWTFLHFTLPCIIDRPP